MKLPIILSTPVGVCCAYDHGVAQNPAEKRWRTGDVKQPPHFIDEEASVQKF